jgi:NADH-quinone oxidoreductase subunit I
MRHLRDALRALLTTLRNVFRPPVTVAFPLVIRPRPPRYRVSFALLHDEHGEELCIGCLQCERICPSQVISIKQAPKRESKVTGKKRGWAEDFVLDSTACISCELCVQVCPEDAIVMTQEPDAPAYAREDLVLTMQKLYANEQLKPAAWGNGTRLMGMQEVPKEEKKPKAAKPDAAPAPAPAPAAPAPVAVAK